MNGARQAELSARRPASTPAEGRFLIDGILNLNKPTGISSARALDRVRRATGIRKSGHGGTLDPAAEGVLLICLGQATKLVESLMDQPKVYRTRVRLDVTSESFDADRPLVPVHVERIPDRDAVLNALQTIERATLQVPPAISALKIGGRRAYQRQRAGEQVLLPPRAVRIYWMVLHRFEWPDAEIELACGRGTYVRAIARDLGAALGTGGCLTGLVRKSVGPFSLSDSWTFESLEKAAEIAAAVMPIDRCRSLLSEQHLPVRPF